MGRGVSLINKWTCPSACVCSAFSSEGVVGLLSDFAARTFYRKRNTFSLPPSPVCIFRSSTEMYEIMVPWGHIDSSHQNSSVAINEKWLKFKIYCTPKWIYYINILNEHSTSKQKFNSTEIWGLNHICWSYQYNTSKKKKYNWINILVLSYFVHSICCESVKPYRKRSLTFLASKLKSLHETMQLIHQIYILYCKFNLKGNIIHLKSTIPIGKSFSDYIITHIYICIC